ncbi:hypothetical protein LguiA_002103 [Lonicera macranthoides]
MALEERDGVGGKGLGLEGEEDEEGENCNLSHNLALYKFLEFPMATSFEAQAVKSLNKSPGRRRFVFKKFSQRVEEIDIGVFRSLDPLKLEPTEGSSFFRDCLVQWRELNTAEDFISFYEEMTPLVQTLPQIILQKELILSELLSRLKMKGRLSLEPILRLIAALSRDLLEDFLPFLQRIADSLVLLLNSGADKEPEIIEQIFTSWSCIMMYLQKYLVKDIVHVLKVTVKLRYFPKDYIQEFMAESVSFLLRNAPVQELIKGVRRIMFEFVKKPLEMRKSGASALLCYSMRGTSSRLHSRAEQRICEEIEPKEMNLIWDCLYHEITDCMTSGYSLHLKRLLSVLVSTLQVLKISDYQPVVQLVSLLLKTFIIPSDTVKAVDQPSEIIDEVLQLMLCILDGLHCANNNEAISQVSVLWAPVFKLKNSSLLTFIKELLPKDPLIIQCFRINFISALINSIETSEEEVIHLLVTFCERIQAQRSSLLDGVSIEDLSKIRNFFKESIQRWIQMINDTVQGDPLYIELQEAKLALLWGIVSCYPYLVDVQSNQSLLMDLVDALDRLLVIDSGLRKATWQSVIGAALSSYHKLHFGHQTGYEESAVLQLLHSIETTPLSIATSRLVILQISKIQMGLSASRISESYMPIVLNGVIGIFHNRFSHLWNPAMECLAVLIGIYFPTIWERYVKYLERCVCMFLTSNDKSERSHTESSGELLQSFNTFITSESDNTPGTAVLSLLIQSLQKVPTVSEARSRQIVPLFLKFLGYNVDDLSSVKSYDSQVCKGKEWKLVLKEWLNLLILMRNSKSFYLSQFLKEVLQYRLLDENDADLQMMVLDCLLNWKDDYLLPYNQHLKNLISTKTLREELTLWSLSPESNLIDERHRPHLVPMVIRILIPKVRKLKTLASRKAASVHSRKAVLGFLSQLEVDELPLFYALLIEPLGSISQGVDAISNWLWGSPQSSKESFDSYGILRHFTVDNIKALSWKKRYGFLHVIEDILGVFDEFHIVPFLDLLMGCIVRILASCTSSLDTVRSSVSSVVENSSSLELHTDKEDSGEKNKILRTKESKKKHRLTKGDCRTTDHGRMEGYGRIRTQFAFNMSDRAPTLTAMDIRQFKDLRSLCLKIFSFVLGKYEDHNFGNEFWDLFFTSVKPLIDGFKQEGASSEKPSSLLSCFLAMSGSYKLVPLLYREKNLVPDIFSILTVNTASEAIVSYVLKFIANLLNLDSEIDNDDDAIKRVLLPNLDALVCSLHHLFTCKSATKRKLVKSPGERELIIFKLLSKYIKDPSAARKFVDILLPLLTKRLENSVASVETLQVIRHIMPLLGSESISKILNTVSPLVISGGQDVRLSICDLLDTLSGIDSSILAVAKLLRELNETSALEMGGLDYDTVLGAYEKINIDFFYTVREEHASVILSHFVHDMSSEELILRQSAYRILLLFVDFCGKILNEEVKLNEGCWSGASVERMINNFLLKHMGDGMNKEAAAQKVWIDLLREMVVKLPQVITNKVFLPLLFNTLFDVQDGKGEHLRIAALEAIASISGRMEWKQYYALLMRCFRELISKPDKQKLLLRLICSILNHFHFLGPNSDHQPKNSLGDTDIHTSLQKTIYPKIQKLLSSDSDSVNVNVSLVALKLLKLFPGEIMDVHLPNIIHRISNFLKNRLESVRDEARSALAACLKELGLEYLQFIVKVLRATLKRGFELHVLGYTLNFLLSKSLSTPISGKLDYCLEDLLSVVENDILGDVSEEKEVDKIASKMKETRKRKSFETLKLISQNVTFKTHALKLLSPVTVHLQKHLTPKVKSKLETMLNNIAAGIESNPSVNQTDLFIFTYGLIEDGNNNKIPDLGKSYPKRSNRNTDKEASSIIIANPQCSHLITVFALGVLQNRLKNMKLNKNDDQLMSMLDPFVRLLGDCLCSNFEDIISAALRCLYLLVRLPLPSLESQADKIKGSVLVIAQGSLDADSPLMQSCIRLLTVLLRSTSITLSSDQLHMLIQFPLFVDLERNPSFLALSLLKAIVNRKLVVHEIYDLVTRVAELMVTSQAEPVRKKCSQILLQFLLDYHLSKKRLQQHLDFLLANLRQVYSIHLSDV